MSLHPFNRLLVSPILAEHVEGFDALCAKARRDARALPPLILHARSLAGYQAGIEPSAPVLPRALRVIAQAAAAIFTLAAEPKMRTVEVSFDGQKNDLLATGPTSAAHAENWRLGLFCALILRDRATIDRLCTTRLEILEASSTRGQVALVATLQAVVRDRSVAESTYLLEEALKATRAGWSETVEFVQCVVVAQMKLVSRILAADRAGFEKSLAEALHLHRRYWLSAAKTPHAPEALFPFGIIALTCLARDRGVVVGVGPAFAAVSEFLHLGR